MLKNKKVKLAMISLLLPGLIWLVLPQSSINAIFHRGDPVIGNIMETKVKTAPDENLSREEKPAFFNIIKFIGNFIPVKSQRSGKISEKISHIYQYYSSL